MGNYEQLKQAVVDVIKSNGNQEITGAILQNALLSIISTVGANSTFAGIATPETNPGTPDQNIFYIASQNGIYSNFGGVKIFGEIAILTNKNGNWEKEETVTQKGYTKPTFFLNTDLDKYFKEFYIEGLDVGTDYCLRTLRLNTVEEPDIYQINIGNSSSNVLQINVKVGEVYAEAKSGNISAKVVLQNTDGIVGNLIFGNTDTSIGTLNKSVCQDTANSPYCASTTNAANIAKGYTKPTFFLNTDLDKYFKEFYIEGLDVGTDYCLRTLRLNTVEEPDIYQINIGNSSSNVLQINVKVGEVYAEAKSGNISAKVVLQNTDGIVGNLIFGNTDTSIGTLNKSVCQDTANSPYCASTTNAANIANSMKIAPAFNGYSLPKNPQTLKVLHVGNSFADQPISKLQMWFDAMGIENVIYCIVMRAGGSLYQHYNSIINDEPYDENSAFRIYKNINGETTYIGNADPTDKSGNTTTSNQIKLSDCLQFTDWDVITFQQASFVSGKWETIEPYLPTLIKYARYYCPNSGVKIGWQMTWAYAKGYTGLSSYNNSQAEMYNGIIQCAKNVCSYYDIDLIVPNGVVVQNLRNVDVAFWGDYLNQFRGAEFWSSETPNADFTDDGLHPNDIAEYCTAAAFVMMIYGACYNKSIRGIDAVLGIISGNYAKVARQCVLKAVGERFNTSAIDTTNILE